MKLVEAQCLFKKHCPEVHYYLKRGKGRNQLKAACFWDGFKKALILTGQLDEQPTETLSEAQH